jgi:23S rRNA (adenine2503-C2)-methyltransferase
MKLVEIVKSKLDNTLKYIFRSEDDLIFEFSYIDKNDGKDIMCLPSQSMCNLACKFCHTTDYIGKIRMRNITWEEILIGVKYIIDDLHIRSNSRTLLVSFMGCGEPILNYENITIAMSKLKDLEKDGIPYVRFAIATSIPAKGWLNFYKMTRDIKKFDIPVKVHLSLHYTTEPIRRKWMPSSLDIMSSLSCVDFYRKLTGNPVEIHYTLIDGVNDTEQDAMLLRVLLRDKMFNVKFLYFNEKPTLEYHASKVEKMKMFDKYLSKYNIDTEYYVPPGLDVGASCGQFLMGHYEKNKITSKTPDNGDAV